MADSTNFVPTILLIDEFGEDCYAIRNWFETNGYNVRESSDVYDALEEITDITLEQRPDMILFNSYSSSQDCSWVLDSLQEFVEERGLPIVSLATDSNSKDFLSAGKHFVRVESFDLLKPLMQKLLPVVTKQAQAA